MKFVSVTGREGACLAQDAKLIGLSLVQMDNAAALKDDLLS